MSRGTIGAKTGGKGSWRRKAKKVTQDTEGDKLWVAALRMGCRTFGHIDSVLIFFEDQGEGIALRQPELVLDARANTFLVKGTAETKPLAGLRTELSREFNIAQDESEPTSGPSDGELGNIPAHLDFPHAAEARP